MTKKKAKRIVGATAAKPKKKAGLKLKAKASTRKGAVAGKAKLATAKKSAKSFRGKRRTKKAELSA